jgi:hypothetical protein
VNRYLRAALTVTIPMLALAGCNDFLKCDDCINDPNSATTATSNQRFVAIQANLWQFLNGQPARVVAMWMQQLAGTSVQFQVWDQYLLDAGMADGESQAVYTGGGLVDLRAIEADSRARGDRIYLGIAQVVEGWMMGTEADIWGDVPYSQAAKADSFPTPMYDSQQQVYADVLALLDDAIGNLQSGEGAGPGAADLVYQGDPAKWLQLAHTLEARLHLHLAERDPANYALALQEANQGISSPSADYLTVQTDISGQQNDWYQFMVNGLRTGLLRAGKFGVDLLANAGDPRLTEYYQKGTTATGITGAEPGQALESWMGNLSELRLDPAYRQPLVTWNENLLIKAEALLHAGNTGAALDTLNAERAAWGEATDWHSALSLPPVSGPVTLADIMTEKYLVLFQNIEYWNDYKRTCLPAITPAAGKANVPGRLLYGTTERQTNPNVPDDPARNWNDPEPCSGS